MTEKVHGRPKFRLSKIVALHVWTLVTLAVAHPLYEILGQADHAPFFIAHQSRAIDVWLLVALLAVVLPAALLVVLSLVNLFAPRLATALAGLLFLILFTSLFLHIAGRLLPQNLDVALGVAAGAAATLLYLTTSWARMFVTFMSVVTVLSPALFLNSTSVRAVFSAPEPANDVRTRGSTQVPNVVMIVFDELPLTSLLDENREIDSARYPNFHRLAQTATWFRNTTTVHYATSGALASLLVAGDSESYLRRMHPDRRVSGGTVDRVRFPSNLFSLLENYYEVFAVEPITKLAQETEVLRTYRPPLEARLRALVLDSVILYGHLVAPPQFRGRLPVVEGQWRDFLGAGEATPHPSSWPYEDAYGKTSTAKQFIDLLQKRNAPSFYFLHLLLPHFPFIYNEDGKIHLNKFSFMTMHLREATGRNGWPEESSANLAYQAHLLQLVFTDRLLGLILDRLVALNLFDQALVVVTSDHGTSFYWDSAGLLPEKLSQVQASETMLVPFLLKLPGQRRGRISDAPVQTIDIVPTTADVLDVELDWEVDGVSVLGDAPAKSERFAYVPKRRKFGDVVDPHHLALRRKLELFGSGSLEGIYRHGPHPELVNHSVASFPSQDSTATVKLSRSPSIRVDPKGSRLPAYVEGEIEGLPESANRSKLAVAVAVNGVIRSTAATMNAAISSLRPQNATIDEDARGVYFLARLPPAGFVEGGNRVTVHAIVEEVQGNAVSLVELEEK